MQAEQPFNSPHSCTVTVVAVLESSHVMQSKPCGGSKSELPSHASPPTVALGPVRQPLDTAAVGINSQVGVRVQTPLARGAPHAAIPGAVGAVLVVVAGLLAPLLESASDTCEQ